MSRFQVLSLALITLVLSMEFLSAQTPDPFWILIETRGNKVQSRRYPTEEEVDDREEALTIEAAEAVKTNEPIARELRPLITHAANLKKQHDSEKNPTKKAALKTRLDAADKAVADKKRQLKPPVTWTSKSFTDMAAADQYVRNAVAAASRKPADPLAYLPPEKVSLLGYLRQSSATGRRGFSYDLEITTAGKTTTQPLRGNNEQFAKLRDQRVHITGYLIDQRQGRSGAVKVFLVETIKASPPPVGSVVTPPTPAETPPADNGQTP